ncbi:MAG: T9SS type A sorting domain-containing protein [Cytophagales bacterium]|nr:T9SS type A sorting domain-containing protein [Bernardetiaceae bacterium]MDW8206125.1 T9SS type A sorting domain-containing protein [Cytophagales bacterium]
MRIWIKKYSLFCFLQVLMLFENNLFGQARIHFGNSFLVFTGATASNPIYLTIGNSNANAVIRTGSGHVISNNEFQRIRWRIGSNTGNYVFPFGRNMTEYCPFVANISIAGAGAGYFDVSTWHAPAPSHAPLPSGGFYICPATAKIVNRFWRIEPAGYSTMPTAGHIRFHYLVSELNGIPEALLKAQRGNLSITSCPWENPVGTVNTALDYVQVDNVSQFSPWTLSHQNFPLPVELVHFSASWLKDHDPPQVLLEWQTANEQNNAYFEIERSADGIHFNSLVRILGTGNSNLLRSYSYTDNHPLPVSSIYYRLKQVDYDGTVNYSRIIVLQRYDVKPKLIVFPNPAQGRLQFELFNLYNHRSLVEIIDYSGRVVYRGYAVAHQNNLYSIDINHLSTGIYLLRVFLQEEHLSARFIVK